MKKKLILIAEDESAYRRILKDSLEKEGYRVVVVSNGDKLLNYAKLKESSLVILDLIMPVKNGFEVLAEMKQNKQLKLIPIIALSNLGQEEDIEKAKKLGAAEYIVKSDETIYKVMDKINRLLN